jgi:hypothetical protein
MTMAQEPIDLLFQLGDPLLALGKRAAHSRSDRSRP